VFNDSLIWRQYIQDLSDHDNAVAEFVRELILFNHIAVLYLTISYILYLIL